MAMPGHQRSKAQVVIDVVIAIEITKMPRVPFFDKDGIRIVGAIIARHSEGDTLQVLLVRLRRLGRALLESAYFFLQICVHRILHKFSQAAAAAAIRLAGWLLHPDPSIKSIASKRTASGADRPRASRGRNPNRQS